MTTANVLATLTAVAIAAPIAFADVDVDADDTPVHECPVFMRDSTLILADTAGGSAITITTPHAQHVPVLRLALREAAAFVERRAEELAIEAVAIDDQPQIPLVRITTQNVKSGLSLTIRAKKLGDISVVRRQARMIEVLWRNSPCMKPSDRPRKLPPGSVSA
jgi:hypothetical protein